MHQVQLQNEETGFGEGPVASQPPWHAQGNQTVFSGDWWPRSLRHQVLLGCVRHHASGREDSKINGEGHGIKNQYSRLLLITQSVVMSGRVH